jgi:hypothetical protein
MAVVHDRYSSGTAAHRDLKYDNRMRDHGMTNAWLPQLSYFAATTSRSKEAYTQRNARQTVNSLWRCSSRCDKRQEIQVSIKSIASTSLY